MTVVLIGASVWLAIACPVALVVGRAIAQADHPPRPRLHLIP